MIAFLVTVYAAVVLTLFKLKLVKPRPYPIAIVVLAGILMIGGVVVAWMQYAPMSGNLVTNQYVVQLVPYNVKGYVKKVFAKANEPFVGVDPRAVPRWNGDPGSRARPQDSGWQRAKLRHGRHFVDSYLGRRVVAEHRQERDSRIVAA